jgi:hypothetical protein
MKYRKSNEKTGKKMSLEENKMANKKFLWGMLALVLSFGMAVVGCDNSGGSTDGVLTVTDIPSQYNGKYAWAISDFSYLLGARKIDMKTETLTLTRISNGSVSIPMWVQKRDGTYERYFGDEYLNSVFTIAVAINNSETSSGERDPNMITHLFFYSAFPNGSATISWNNGRSRSQL